MIIITRTYEVDNPSGGRPLVVTTRKVFADNDMCRVQAFLDERSTVKGHEWYNINFHYTKL